jgi:hypothetical protein
MSNLSKSMIGKNVSRMLLLVVVLSGCASVGPRERIAARLAEVEAHAAAPVDSFRLWRLDRWESLGRTRLLVWTRPNEAWLLTVDEPCNDLEYAHGLSLTSSVGQVKRRFDSVVLERQRCRINEIRPVDGRALKIASRADAGSAAGE